MKKQWFFSEKSVEDILKGYTGVMIIGVLIKIAGKISIMVCYYFWDNNRIKVPIPFLSAIF